MKRVKIMAAMVYTKDSITNLCQKRGVYYSRGFDPCCVGEIFGFSKNDYAISSYIENYREDLHDVLITMIYKLLVRDTLGTGIMMLGIDDDHGNGD